MELVLKKKIKQGSSYLLYCELNPGDTYNVKAAEEPIKKLKKKKVLDTEVFQNLLGHYSDELTGQTAAYREIDLNKRKLNVCRALLGRRKRSR